MEGWYIFDRANTAWFFTAQAGETELSDNRIKRVNMQNIIITGANGNLGKSVVAEFSQKDFFLNLIERTDVQNTASQAFFSVDVTDGSAVEQMVQGVISSKGTIDLAILLVGMYAPGDVDKTTSADVEKMMRVNFYSAVHFVNSLLPHFKSAGRGKFIFIGAKGAMHTTPASHNVAYALSKQALYSYADMINKTRNSNNVSAHIFLPTTIDTETNRAAMPTADFSKWISPALMAKDMLAIAQGRDSRLVVEY